MRYSQAILLITLSATVLIGRTTSTAAQPANVLDYAIYGGDDVTLQTYSCVVGDVFSGEDLTLEFGYGIQTPPNSGDMYAIQDFVVESLSEVDGDVFANGTATEDGGPSVLGTIHSGAGTVLPLSLPPAASFSATGADVTQNSSFTLPPGNYGHVVQNGLFDEVRFSSGDYFFKSLAINSSSDVVLDLSGGPINFYIEGNLHFDSGLDFYVNGDLVGTGDDAAIKPLASQVLWETHGDVSMELGFLSYFFGTIFAPFGDVQMATNEFYGAIIASDRVDAELYLEHYPSDNLLSRVPEPSTWALALTGLVVGIAARGRRRRNA